MIESGEVVRVQDDSADVTMVGSDSCEACGACHAVGAGRMIMEDVEDRLSTRVGDLVEVEIPEGSRLVGALVGYGTPIVVLVVGYLAGVLLSDVLRTDTDLTGAVFAVVSVVVMLIAVRYRGRDLLGSDRFRPRIHAIIRRTDGRA